MFSPKSVPMHYAVLSNVILGDAFKPVRSTKFRKFSIESEPAMVGPPLSEVSAPRYTHVTPSL